MLTQILSFLTFVDTAGLSLSTVSRSVLQIEPDSPEAAELRRWWTSEGCTAEFAHAGEGLATAKKYATALAACLQKTLDVTAYPMSIEHAELLATRSGIPGLA